MPLRAAYAGSIPNKNLTFSESRPMALDLQKPQEEAVEHEAEPSEHESNDSFRRHMGEIAGTKKTRFLGRAFGASQASCRRQNTQYSEMMPPAAREVKRLLSSDKSPRQSGSTPCDPGPHSIRRKGARSTPNPGPSCRIPASLRTHPLATNGTPRA